jgi:hemerythrin-like metal-binding protein
MLMTWKPELATGVRLFDAEHKQLIAMINELHAAMLAGHSASATADVLRQLIDYTEVHFQHEEDALTRSGYPAAEDHRQEHEKLKARVFEFVVQNRAADGPVSAELLHFLREWLLHHIEKTDKAYGAFLNSKGIV